MKPIFDEMMKVEKELSENFTDENGKVYLVQCPICHKENYASAVSHGICAWCGYNANDPIGEENIGGESKRMEEEK